MALNINNNNYAGVLTEGLSMLISIGSNDSNLFHVATTNGSKVRLSYVDADVVLQDLSTGGICSLVDAGDRDLDFCNMDLAELGTQQSKCISELYSTDYADAGRGYLAQEVDTELLNAWAVKLTDKYSKKMQDLRWAGDTGSGNADLAYHDGVIVQIQALGAYATGNTCGYQQITNTTVTASNVITEMKKVIEILPFEVTADADFKLVLAPAVAKALQNALMTATGVTNLALNVDFDTATGRIMSNFFGYAVYVAAGLGASVDTANVILGGIFVDGEKGNLKWGVNTPSDEKDIEMKLVDDGDKMRCRLASGQAVCVIPCGSQIAMNA